MDMESQKKKKKWCGKRQRPLHPWKFLSHFILLVKQQKAKDKHYYGYMVQETQNNPSNSSQKQIVKCLIHKTILI